MGYICINISSDEICDPTQVWYICINTCDLAILGIRIPIIYNNTPDIPIY